MRRLTSTVREVFLPPKNRCGPVGFAMPFAYELMGVAMMRRMEGNDQLEKLQALMKEVCVAVGHLVEPILLLALPKLWN